MDSSATMSNVAAIIVGGLAVISMSCFIWIFEYQRKRSRAAFFLQLAVSHVVSGILVVAESLVLFSLISPQPAIGWGNKSLFAVALWLFLAGLLGWFFGFRRRAKNQSVG
jgi:hypothetical protein